MLMDSKGKHRCGEKEIEHQHTANGGKNIAAAGGCDHRGQQSSQQIHRNDIGLCKTYLGETETEYRCQNQDTQGQRPVPASGFEIDLPFRFFGLVAAIFITPIRSTYFATSSMLWETKTTVIFPAFCK